MPGSHSRKGSEEVVTGLLWCRATCSIHFLAVIPLRAVRAASHSFPPEADLSRGNEPPGLSVTQPRCIADRSSLASSPAPSRSRGRAGATAEIQDPRFRGVRQRQLLDPGEGDLLATAQDPGLERRLLIDPTYQADRCSNWGVIRACLDGLMEPGPPTRSLWGVLPCR
jgi:hypothetical protein